MFLTVDNVWEQYKPREVISSVGIYVREVVFMQRLPDFFLKRDGGGRL